MYLYFGIIFFSFFINCLGNLTTNDKSVELNINPFPDFENITYNDSSGKAISSLRYNQEKSC